MGVIMLTAVKLVDQWRTVETELPSDWSSARLRIRPEDPAEAGEVGRILGPMTAGRVGDEIVVTVERAGGPAGPQAAARLFGYLDDARVWCVIEPAEIGHTAAAPSPVATEEGSPSPGSPLEDQWHDELATLPEDWSDVLAEIEIDSSDDLDRGALLCAPLNPTRDGDRPAFTFRCASRAGYGASAAMAGRCFARCDEEAITGRVSILRTLSETDLIGTQGPAWRVGGKVL